MTKYISGRRMQHMAEEIMPLSLRKCVSFLNSPKNKLKKNIFSFHTHTHTQQSVSRVAKKILAKFFLHIQYPCNIGFPYIYKCHKNVKKYFWKKITHSKVFHEWQKKYWLIFFYIFSILVTLAFYTYINVIKTLKYIFEKKSEISIASCCAC